MYSAGGQQGGGEDDSAENSETEENMDTEEGVVEVSTHHYIYMIEIMSYFSIHLYFVHTDTFTVQMLIG